MIINSSVLFSTQHVRAAHHSAAYHLALLLISLSFRDAIRTIQLWGNSAKQSSSSHCNSYKTAKTSMSISF